MPENTGLYKKYNVTRVDGKAPTNAAYFVLDVVNDPHAQTALRVYRISCEGTLPQLAKELMDLNDELATGNHDGTMVIALRTPRK